MRGNVLTVTLGITLVMVLGAVQITKAQSGWQLVYSNVDQYMEEIFFIAGPNNDWQTGWAIEQSGNVIKTTDGGNTWTTYSTAPYSSISGICFIDANTGWICTYGGSILKSTNGGATWSLNSAPGTWFSAIKFSDDLHGVVVGTPCMYTTDGGATWQTATGGMAFNNMCYGSGTTFWACDMWSGTVAKSTNNGQSWTASTTISELLVALGFFNAAVGLSGGSDMTLKYTTDGGSNWTSKTLGSGSGDLLSAAYQDQNKIWVGTSSGIYKSSNGGVTWVLDTLISGVGHRAMFATPTGKIYVAGDVYATFDSQIWRKDASEPFYADFTVSDSTICTGNTVTFTNQSSPSATSFLWTFEGGTPPTSTAVNPSVTYNSAGDFDVSLQVSNATQSATTVKPDYMQVLTIPGAPQTPTGNTAPCQGTMVYYATDPVLYATSYNWVANPPEAGFFSGSGTTTLFTCSSTYAGSYTVKVQAQNYCGNSAFSPPLNCILYLLPTAYTMTGEGGYCEGGPGAEIGLDGSQSGVDYELYIDGAASGIVVSGTGSPISFGYQMAEGAYTCTGYTSSCFNYMSGVVNVQMYGMPGPASTPAGPTDPCNNEVSVYTTTATEADTIMWTLTPASAGTMNPSGMQVEIEWDGAFTGVAQLSAYAENPCGTGSPSPNLDILVHQAAMPEISGETEVCKGEVHAYQTADNPGNTYAWTVTGGTIQSGAGTHLITVQWGNPGNGTVVVTESTAEGCVTTSENVDVTIDDCTAIGDPDGFPGFTIFPNPASSLVNIVASCDGEVRIYTLQGQSMGVRVIRQGMQQIDLSALPEGIYLLQLFTDKHVFTSKLLIH